MANVWKKTGWRDFPRIQMPEYENKETLAKVERELASYPPLVFAGEVRNLKARLAEVSKGRVVPLARRGLRREFWRIRCQHPARHLSGAVADGGRADTWNQASRGQGWTCRRAVRETAIFARREARRGRASGLPWRYHQRHRIHCEVSKAESETHAAGIHPVGGILESSARVQHRRFCRHSPVHAWNLGFARESGTTDRYQKIADRISDALGFMTAAGVNPDNSETLKAVEFYTSHEALLLEYEEALCRIDSTSGRPVAGSGHLIWIGDRTRSPDGAHVEFCRGVQNPIGLKCGPSIEPDDLSKLADILNPQNEPGRLTLIARFGAGTVGDHLPRLINRVQSEGRNVVWSCDPMHGNTIKASNGYKTRPFDSVLREVKEFFAIHHAEGSYPGGVHFEMTGKDVTECTGGMQAVDEMDLSSRYHTVCDPRLNASQALELAFLIAEELDVRRSAELKAS